MGTALDQSSLPTYRAAWVRDVQKRTPTAETVRAKMAATESAQVVIDRVLQMFGGKGVAQGNTIERLYRDSLSRERARTDMYSYKGRGLSAYALWQVNPDWQLIANYRHQRDAYDAPMAFFPDARKDRQNSVALTGLWDISRYTGHDMVVRMQYLYIDNPSNVGLYDYSRKLATVGLQVRF